MLPARSHHSPAFSIHLIILVTFFQQLVHCSLKITNRSFRHAAPHLWSKLPSTLCVPYQSGASPSPSSSPSSGSDPGPVVDISHGVFHSRLKIFLFSKFSLHSHLSLPRAHLLQYDHSAFDSHWRR